MAEFASQRVLEVLDEDQRKRRRAEDSMLNAKFESLLATVNEQNSNIAMLAQSIHALVSRASPLLQAMPDAGPTPQVHQPTVQDPSQSFRLKPTDTQVYEEAFVNPKLKKHLKEMAAKFEKNVDTFVKA